MTRNLVAVTALIAAALVCSQASARPPTNSAKVTGALRSILGNMEIDVRTWGDNPDFRAGLDRFAGNVLDTRRWTVKKFEQQGNKITFDAYKITDRDQVFTHGWRVRGTITSKRKAALEVWKLADGFCSSRFNVSRQGRKASVWAGHNRGNVQVLTKRSMQLCKPVPGYKTSGRRTTRRAPRRAPRMRRFR